MAQRGSNPVVRFVVLLVVLAAGAWGFRAWRGDRNTPSEPADAPQTAETAAELPVAPAPEPAPHVALPPAPEPAMPLEAAAPQPPAAASDEQIAEARRNYRDGLEKLAAGALVEARGLLSAALASGVLSVDDADACRHRLTELADRLVFSREIYPDDPFARVYRVKPGDSLQRICKREKLYVPHEGVQRINGISDPRRIQIGQRLKLIQGPFDAIITKSHYTLDLYHHGMFVRSFHIGLGQNGSTPTGRWLVRDRVPQATWTPPPSVEGSRTLECGEPGYPLGTEGLWIALQGLDPANEVVSGFGIHGTNEPDSIGKQASHGCIRLRDDDISMVFHLLCAGQSRVLVRP